MDNLYVHLQSDSSPEFFPNNTICDFRNQLAGSLELDPAYYEVALVQCSYVYNPPCIKAGKEVAQLKVIGPVIDFCDTVQSIIDQNVLFDIDSHCSFIEQNVFKLTLDNLSNYQERHSFDKINDLSQFLQKTERIYQVTEKTYEIRLGREVNSFDELLSFVNEKLKKYQSRIYYKKDSNPNLIREFHKSVQSIEFMGTYDGMFNKNIPYGNFMANKINVRLNTLVFKITVTSKVELLGEVIHQHHTLIPIGTSVGTLEKTISAADYYGNDVNGSVKVLEYIYPLILDEDVYDISELIKQLQQKLPSMRIKYKNNVVSLVYSNNLHKYIQLEVTDQIKAVLGLTEVTSIPGLSNTQEERGCFRPFFGYGQQKMYIYADIIENQFIGSQLAPLLRITDYKGQNATTTTQEFAHHHYVPLRNMNLDQIHVYIRSENSDYLPIEVGTFAATLHFRRKRI